MRSHLIFLIALMVSCDSGSRKPDDSPNEEGAIDVADVKSALSHYLLPGLDSITDENTLVFYKEQRWDTSFVLTLRRDTSKIVGIYHEVSPENMEADYLADVGFFEGFTFTIDMATWEKVIHESKLLLDSINHVPYTGCLDCGEYMLSYGGKFSIPARDRSSFEAYDKFLRRTVVYPIYRKRRAMKEGKVPGQGGK